MLCLLLLAVQLTDGAPSPKTYKTYLVETVDDSGLKEGLEEIPIPKAEASLLDRVTWDYSDLFYPFGHLFTWKKLKQLKHNYKEHKS